MSNVVIYHPDVSDTPSVPEESLPQMRQSGWILLSEHQENEAAREKREAAEAAAASKTSGKGDK
jgi:hypothetical protein